MSLQDPRCKRALALKGPPKLISIEHEIHTSQIKNLCMKTDWWAGPRYFSYTTVDIASNWNLKL